MQPPQVVKSFETFETFEPFTDGGGDGGSPPLRGRRPPDPGRRLGIWQESRPVREGYFAFWNIPFIIGAYSFRNCRKFPFTLYFTDFREDSLQDGHETLLFPVGAQLCSGTSFPSRNDIGTMYNAYMYVHYAY